MRSRPRLTVFLSPEKPRPGDELRVVAQLESRSETPSEGTVFRLDGKEARYSHTSSSGKSTTVHYKYHPVVALEARTDPRTLTVGTYRHEALFPLPTDAPPSIQTNLSSIKYQLDVRVSIPWWPDRRERYEITVLPPRWRAEPAGARVYTSREEGPAHGETYIEATLDPSAPFVGGELVGAISLANVAKRARRLKVALVGVDVAHFESATMEGEVRHYEWTIVDGRPPEGERIPFRAKLPESELPSFTATLFHLQWKVEVVVENAWARDAKIVVPVTIAPEGSLVEGATALRRLPPVGHERRAKAWARIAATHGFENDAESETMTARVGGTTVRVHLEQRPEKGLFTVAYVDWPDLGIGLSIGERRWTDAFRSKLATQDRAFDARFAVRAREQEQLDAFLKPKLRATLLASAEVAADDAGALLAEPGGGHRLETLDAFVRVVLEVARLADKAVARVPAPAAMRDHLPAWRTFAATTRGRLEVGSMSIEGARFDGSHVDVRTEWAEAGDAPAPLQTRLTLLLPSDADPTREAAREALASARGQLPSLELGEGRLVASVPAPVIDPATLSPTLRLLAGVAAAMSPSGRAGPYR